MSPVLQILLTAAELLAAVLLGVFAIYLVFAGADAWIVKLRGGAPAFEWWAGTPWRDRSCLGHRALNGIGMTLTLAVAGFGVIAALGLLAAAAQCLSGNCPEVPDLP